MTLNPSRFKLNAGPKTYPLEYYMAPQVNEKIEKVRQIYNALDIQIKQKSMNNEVIPAGGFNAKLQVNNPHVKQEESRNGKILKEVIKDNSLYPISLDATQGMWARQNRSKTDEKSIIDYVLVTEQIKKSVTERIVDKEGQFRTRGKNDYHNTMKIRMKINDLRRPTFERWKLDNEEGLTEFNEMTNNNRIKEIIEQASYNETIKITKTQ